MSGYAVITSVGLACTFDIFHPFVLFFLPGIKWKHVEPKCLKPPDVYSISL